MRMIRCYISSVLDPLSVESSFFLRSDVTFPLSILSIRNRIGYSRCAVCSCLGISSNEVSVYVTESNTSVWDLALVLVKRIDSCSELYFRIPSVHLCVSHSRRKSSKFHITSAMCLRYHPDRRRYSYLWAFVLWFFNRTSHSNIIKVVLTTRTYAVWNGSKKILCLLVLTYVVRFLSLRSLLRRRALNSTYNHIGPTGHNCNGILLRIFIFTKDRLYPFVPVNIDCHMRQ